VITRRAPWLLALLPLTALAGHGLLNSFNDLQWLPAPGRTPDQWHYWLDGWRERSALLLANDNNTRLKLCLDTMREKLAEAEAMVGKADQQAAAIAIAHYRDYLDRAQALVDGPSSLSARLALARALLEHQYMLSVDYVDLPLAPRAVLATLIEALDQRYSELRKQLPLAQAQALFFKEEEVRWSWEMARRAAETVP
jgi:Domain of unknown function (DUF5667)